MSKKPKLMDRGHADNFQTPPSALLPLIKYLKKDWRIWEPAAGKGNLVRTLSELGFNCVGTDKETGSDFLKCGAPIFDCIVTNPPYTIKEKFLARCYEFNKPFALLMPLTTFDGRARRDLFRQKGVQVIMPDGRISFETPSGNGSSAWFYTVWFTWRLNLPEQINFSQTQLSFLDGEEIDVSYEVLG